MELVDDGRGTLQTEDVAAVARRRGRVLSAYYAAHARDRDTAFHNLSFPCLKGPLAVFQRLFLLLQLRRFLHLRLLLSVQFFGLRDYSLCFQLQLPFSLGEFFLCGIYCA